MLLAGCSGGSVSSFEVTSSNVSMEIKAENSEDGSGDAELVLDSDADVTFDASALTEGSLKITFKDASGNEGPGATVRAKESNTFSVPAGTYTVTVSVVEKATGSASVSLSFK